MSSKQDRDLELFELGKKEFRRLRDKLKPTSPAQKKKKLFFWIILILFGACLAYTAATPDKKATWDLGGTFMVVAVLACLVLLLKIPKCNTAIKEEVLTEAEAEKYRKLESNDKKAASLIGDNKFHQQLTDRHLADNKAQKDLGALATALRSSAYEEKEHNWAVVGGIVDGLAGPVAGAVAAVNTMQKNQEIREQNKKNREAVNDMARNIEKASYDGLRASRNWLFDIKKEFFRHEVSYNWSIDNLYSNLVIKTVSQETAPRTGAVTVTASCSCIDRDLWIDGNIRGKLYTKDGKLAGCVYLSMPLAGTLGQGTLMTGHCASPLIKCPEYDIKYEPINLWRIDYRYSKALDGDGTTEEEHNRQVKQLEDAYLAELNGQKI